MKIDKPRIMCQFRLLGKHLRIVEDACGIFLEREDKDRMNQLCWVFEDPRDYTLLSPYDIDKEKWMKLSSSERGNHGVMNVRRLILSLSDTHEGAVVTYDIKESHSLDIACVDYFTRVDFTGFGKTFIPATDKAEKGRIVLRLLVALVGETVEDGSQGD